MSENAASKGGSENESGSGSDAVPPEALPDEIVDAVPTWENEYFDRVSDRLMYNYDLEKDHRVGGERFDLYGELRMEIQKQFVHPALNYANHNTEEYLFGKRVPSLRVSDVQRFVELGHTLADEWIIADEEHFGTDFTFILVTESITDDVRSLVSGFHDRNLLKFGYYGHYEINLIVVDPESETAVGSMNADAIEACTLWEHIAPQKQGIFSRIAHRFWK